MGRELRLILLHGESVASAVTAGCGSLLSACSSHAKTCALRCESMSFPLPVCLRPRPCVCLVLQDVDYITPPLSASLLGILSRDFLWARVLSETPGLGEEARADLPGKLAAVTAKVDAAASAVSSTVSMYARSSAAAAASSGSAVSGYRAAMGMGMGAASSGSASASSAGLDGRTGDGKVSALGAAVKLAEGVDAEACRCHSAQALKAVVFNLRQRKAERETRRAAAAGGAGAAPAVPLSMSSAAAGGASAGSATASSEGAGAGAGAGAASASAASAADALTAALPAAGAAMATDAAAAVAGSSAAAAGVGSA